MILAGFPLPDRAGATSVPACPSCGDRCMDCGERICSLNGPEPAPRCAEHPCCVGCAISPVYCWACKEILADVAQDRAEQWALDLFRERS